jgi:hypothetical protein
LSVTADPKARDEWRSRKPNGVAVVLGTMLAIVLLAAAARSEPAVSGDQAAWKEVGAAYRKLQTLSGYRMRVATGQPPDMVFEVVPPASVRMTVPAGNGSMEAITVHGQSRFRINAPGGPGPWQCQGSPSTEFPGNPTETIQGPVDVSRGADTVIVGTAVRTYIYRYAAKAQGQTVYGKTTLYVGTQTGLPRRAVTSGGRGDVTIDFYDYGAKIDIRLPPCPGG